MHDDDPRGFEPPARADEPGSKRLVADGGRRWPSLTALQRDCLEGIACLEREGEPTHEAALARELEHTYPNLDDTRLYPTITVLVGHALLERGERRGDGRVEYTPTDAGRALLRARIERLADACGLILVDRADGTPTRETDG
ncbi:helix-turn-helix domain-containing protein [Natrinema altunense]|uniref:Transcriptional regulator PadR family protein n=1 Tax=Natrinema altunense (strain JCM 12890 / CGMCC 1.3731 / AJ2) TaxID=1227494 RepID=L9ZHJ7_NATA2|nr:helix-turn-helix transcriptional regulator [Natrinema altunense]ELY85970.1 transcriptional regulator PadR family protein [Natrinema altunense JCM 12890]